MNVGLFAMALLAMYAAAPCVAATDDQFASDLLVLINEHRSENNLGPLSLDETLNQAAQEHSIWMNRTGQLVHDCPGEKIFDQRWRLWGAMAAAENVGQATISSATRTTCSGTVCTVETTITVDGTPEDFFNGWKNSPDHNTNMLNPAYTRIGVGLAGIYATTDFAA